MDSELSCLEQIKSQLETLSSLLAGCDSRITASMLRDIIREWSIAESTNLWRYIHGK